MSCEFSGQGYSLACPIRLGKWLGLNLGGVSRNLGHRKVDSRS